VNNKTPRHVKRAFLVASFIGSVLKSNQTGRVVLIGLERRANNAMYRFSAVSAKNEPELYRSLSNSGIKMWVDLSETHSIDLLPGEVEIFVEILGYIISPKDYKDFLGFEHFKSNVETTDEKMKKICSSALALSDKINELLGTKNYTEMVRKSKTKKVKKQRDKSKKKKEITPKKKKNAKFLKNQKERERKTNVRSFLQERIAEAKKRKEEEGKQNGE